MWKVQCKINMKCNRLNEKCEKGDKIKLFWKVKWEKINLESRDAGNFIPSQNWVLAHYFLLYSSLCHIPSWSGNLCVRTFKNFPNPVDLNFWSLSLPYQQKVEFSFFGKVWKPFLLFQSLRIFIADIVYIFLSIQQVEDEVEVMNFLSHNGGPVEFLFSEFGKFLWRSLRAYVVL